LHPVAPRLFLNHVNGEVQGEGDTSAPCNIIENGEEDHRNKRKSNSKSKSSLAHHVALARSACKLRYLVGSAPVCYGVPVFLLSSS
jgi:hypothetical protein